MAEGAANPPPPLVETTIKIADDKERGIRDYAIPEFDQLKSGILRPHITAQNFEPKPVMFQMIQAMGQFGGLPSEDPHSHLKSFLEMTDHFLIPGVSAEALRLTPFSYTLRDRAKAWLNSQRPHSIDTWTSLAENFLKKYFPPTRNVKFRNEILMFKQEEDEAVSDSWERFKDLIRKCPHHEIPHCIQLETFYNGLSNSAKIILDATAGGAFTSKTYNEGYDILEKFANNNTDWSNPRAIFPKTASRVWEIDAISALNAQIVALTNLVKNNLSLNGEKSQVQAIHQTLNESCSFCGENHPFECCPGNPASVSYVGNHARNNPFSQTYNPNWRNHPNFTWSGNQGLQPPGASQVQSRPQNPPGFHQSHPQNFQQGQSSQSYAPRQQNASDGNGSIESLLKGFINQTNATLRGFETQLGQFAIELKNRPQGTLPSDTENPKGIHKEHIKAVSIKEIEGIEKSKKVKKSPLSPTLEENSHPFDSSKFPKFFPTPKVAEKPETSAQTSDPSVSCNPAQLAHRGQVVPTPEPVLPCIPEKNKATPDLRELPFPERLKNKNVDEQFKKFLDIFKQLHINIPLVEALEQMPSYVKFLKDILNKERRLGEFETVALTKECSALLTCKIPPKLKDPGSFTIPCSIGGQEVGHALCDLGASINLMPLSVFKKLGIGEVRPTTVTLQLADKSLAYPKGKIEDILVKVDKFIFPDDFLVLDYEADKDVPIILG
ncbi:hypothetical protein L6452_27240 [Arctium lappa]|uniref:Uncharacterized protein n=1 Tax=Arctium lappa TaxID=4217 RepID=A0ACB8ZW36_ARCLA|nr:hypothetical protein L6452_27240 [Arctium lappa]